MTRWFTKATCLLLAMVMLVPTTAFAAKEEQTAQPYSLYFVSYNTWLNTMTARTFQVGFSVTAKRTMDELGVQLIRVQRSSNGVNNWSTQETYTPDFYTQMSDTNSACHMDYVTHTGDYGYYYRAYAEFYAKDSTGTGTISAYSEVIYIPPKT